MLFSNQEKVELSLIDDLKKISSEFDVIFSEEIKMRTEATKLNSRAKELDSRYEKLVTKAKGKADETSNKLKDLGIPEPAILDAIYDALSAKIYKNIISEFR